MSNRTKWVGVSLLLLGMVAGAQYVRAAINHNAPKATTVTIAPEQLTKAAGTLPVTVVESYF